MTRLRRRVRIRNGWSGRTDRWAMAWACLRGEGVVFNARFLLSESEPPRLTPINPVSVLNVHSCLFWADPDDPPVGPKIMLGERSRQS